MTIDRELVKKLIRATNDQPQSNNATFTYGFVVNGEDDKRYIKVDGSENMVPIDLGTDVQSGDRVLVNIENHKAVVIGNLSSPASARTATDFMRFQENEDGSGSLYIGKLDDSGDPTGDYVVIDSDSTDIYVDGKKVAEYGSEGTSLFQNGVRIAKFSSNGMLLNDADGNEIAKFLDDKIFAHYSTIYGVNKRTDFVLSADQDEFYVMIEKDGTYLNQILFGGNDRGIHIIARDESESTYREYVLAPDGLSCAGGPKGIETYLTDMNWSDYINSFSADTINGLFKVRDDLQIQSLGSYNKTSTSSANMHIANNGRITRYVSASSSRRFKDVYETLNEEDVAALFDLDTYWFKYKEEFLNNKDDERYQKKTPGFIVEDWDPVMPIAIDHDKEGLPVGWNVHIMVPLLFEMIKSNRKEIESLKQEIVLLKEEITNE